MFHRILLILFFLSPLDINGEEITWMTINYPPAYIVSGPEKGTGVNDIAMNILIAHLKYHSHEIIENITIPRMLNLFKSGKIHCSPGLAVTENQFKNTVCSKPILIIPPAGVIALKSTLNKLNIKNYSVNLEKLMDNRKLICGIMKGGQYGKYIDGLIKKNKRSPNLYQKTQINQFAYLKMLINRRVDYIIDYPLSYHSNLKKLSKRNRNKFAFVPIKFVKKIKLIRALCNSLPESQRVIEEINYLLKTDKFKKPVISKLISCLPQGMREKYRQINLRYIGVEQKKIHQP